MFLRSELRRHGLSAAPHAARWAAAWSGERILGVAAHAPTGMVLLQAPLAAVELVEAALGCSGRRLAGFFGPLAQVAVARQAADARGLRVLKDAAEDLFALELASLRPPAALRQGAHRCRPALAEDLPLLAGWRAGFRRTVLGEPDGEALQAASRDDVEVLQKAGDLFVLEAGVPLACCSFNAALPGMVQVGNVWTPEDLRGRGYARAVVAGALQLAHSRGVRRAVLSTGRENLAAQAAYRSLGFEPVGDYRLTVFEG